MDSRLLGWNIAASIGFSFILTIAMIISSLIIKAFYPPTLITFSPIIALVKSVAEGIIQVIVLGILAAFTYPIRSKIEGSQLLIVRRISLYTIVGYLVFSLFPYAFEVPYIQTYIGLIIAFNVLNGVLAGGIASIIS